MLLFVGIWVGGLGGGIALMQLAFLIGRDTQRRHLAACNEAAAGVGR